MTQDEIASAIMGLIIFTAISLLTFLFAMAQFRDGKRRAPGFERFCFQAIGCIALFVSVLFGAGTASIFWTLIACL